MNIFEILKNLYTNQKCDWIIDMRDEDIAPFVIQKWLVMNDKIRVQTRWLDKYVFVLSPKMYLSLAWSILPKSQNMPFAKYIKKKDDNTDFDFILPKVRKHFEMSDNDYNAMRSRILAMIKKDMISWFKYYGVEKRWWKRYQVPYAKIKEGGTVIQKESKGLSSWGF